MTRLFKPAQDHLEDLDKVLSHADSVWVKRDREAGLDALMRKKIDEKLAKNHFLGAILYDNNQPQATVWRETSTNHYGHITYHSKDPKYDEDLVNYSIKESYFKEALLEVVQVYEGSRYIDLLKKHPVTINKRQRMSLWLENEDYYKEEDLGVTLEYYLITEEYKETIATMSYEAHKVSKDYEMYPEINNLEKRIELENVVFGGLYGPIIKEASIIAFFEGKPVGYCLLVEVECWGYEKVPWVFDLIVQPGYHGMGIGRELFKRSINSLIGLNYQVMGLAVTNSNAYACRLYEKLGFQKLDNFYEFIQE